MPLQRGLLAHSSFRKSCARAYCAVFSSVVIASDLMDGEGKCWVEGLVPFPFSLAGMRVFSFKKGRSRLFNIMNSNSLYWRSVGYEAVAVKAVVQYNEHTFNLLHG